MVVLEVAPEYGYVVLVAASTAILNIWQGMNVRKLMMMTMMILMMMSRMIRRWAR